MPQGKLGFIVAAFILGLIVPTLYLVLSSKPSKGGSSLPQTNAAAITGTPKDVNTPAPSLARAETASTPTPIPVQVTPTTPTPPAKSPTAPPATPATVPTAAAAPQATAAQLTGRYRLTDTITNGAGTGQSVSFEINLRQAGTTLTGGNSELLLSGRTDGSRAVVSFVQPLLGYQGSFDWAVSGTGASGTFSSSVPNSGVSSLTPLP